MQGARPTTGAACTLVASSPPNAIRKRLAPPGRGVRARRGGSSVGAAFPLPAGARQLTPLDPLAAVDPLHRRSRCHLHLRHPPRAHAAIAALHRGARTGRSLLLPPAGAVAPVAAELAEPSGSRAARFRPGATRVD